MIHLLTIGIFLLKILNWILFIFDQITGTSELQKGRVATFVQFTRSKNALVFPLKLITGRNLGDCIYLSFMSFYLPLYINKTKITDYDFLISIIVFFEQYFIDDKTEHWTLNILSFLLRVWIVANFQYEETFNQYLSSSPLSG